MLFEYFLDFSCIFPNDNNTKTQHSCGFVRLFSGVLRSIFVVFSRCESQYSISRTKRICQLWILWGDSMLRLAQMLLVLGVILAFIQLSMSGVVQGIVYSGTVIFIVAGMSLAIWHNRNEKNNKKRNHN